jgi:hypothetical protein
MSTTTKAIVQFLFAVISLAITWATSNAVDLGAYSAGVLLALQALQTLLNDLMGNPVGLALDRTGGEVKALAFGPPPSSKK